MVQPLNVCLRRGILRSTICNKMVNYDIISSALLFWGLWQNITSSLIVNQLSKMVKPTDPLSFPPNPIKFPKTSSLTSLKTSPQNSIEKVPYSRKVSDEQKQRLVQLITSSNYNMMDAAKAVKISYSSAKKIFTKFRRNLREEAQRKSAARDCKVQAGYILVRSESSLQATLVTSVSLIAGMQQKSEMENGMASEMESS